MDITHKFDINELKCSETGTDYAPQIYIDGFDGGRVVQLWFTARPGKSHEEIHKLINHMHDVLKSCDVQVSADPDARAVGR
ncbi:MAG: hypothetical protein WAJ92_02205 [Candidatus Acidiferrales bacterium]